ncbi:MAG: CPBP family intramembrane metalloprotease, partial [Candidatus Eremiobacteraeota bacterium]|nr:CPBP family intramembrane metalloprotease [Candidatus Eremiobacteraeota bacterium]
LPVCAFAWLALTGRVPVARIARVWFSNFLQNGVSEEFLWRGAFMGRLRALAGAEAAVYLQAFLFGVWHIGADYHAFGGRLVPLFANMLTGQIAVGLALGYVTQRTGNIAIGSVFHAMLDSVDELT